MLWLSLAWRNVAANRRRSAFVAATVMVAAMALMLFAGYIQATRMGLEYSTVRGGTGHFQISGNGGFDSYSDAPLEFGLGPDLQVGIQDRSDVMPGVSRTVPKLSFSGLLSSGPRTLSVAGNGIDPVAENVAFGARQEIVSGKLLNDGAPEDGAVLGTELARRLDVQSGDVVTLITTTIHGGLNAQDLTVWGTVSTGVPQTDLYLLQIALPAAQRLIATDKVSLISVLLNEGADLQGAMRGISESAPGLELRTWRQLSPMFDQVMSMYNTLFAVFGVFLLWVTTFSIVTLILTSVLERTREVGVLRSLGISTGKVRLGFVLEALMLGAAGLAAGTAIGFLLASSLNALDLTAPPPPGRDIGHPFRIVWDWAATLWIWALVLALTASAAWLASSRISKLKVVNALGAV